MEHQISNEYITLTVSAKGAEMRSIEKDSVEYLWNGDPAYYAKWEGICYGNTWICQWTSLPG